MQSSLVTGLLLLFVCFVCVFSKCAMFLPFSYDLLFLIAVSHELLFCLWKYKMAMNVSLDSNNPDDKCSRYEALSWINETLHTNFTQVEQCRSGTV